MSLAGSNPKPEVLSETTDLETLFEAIVGKKPAGPSNDAEDSAEFSGAGEEVKRSPQPAPYVPPVSLERRASSYGPTVRETRSIAETKPETKTRTEPRSIAEIKADIKAFTETRSIIEPSARVEVTSEFPIIMPSAIITPSAPRYTAPALDDAPLVDDEDDANPATVGWLRVVRRSPWPVMIIVAGMALATVSAIGLRSGSSASRVEPPTVTSPPATLPSGYAAQLPTAPLTTPVEGSDAPASTAFGDSSFAPAARSATTPPAAPAATPVAPAPIAPRPAAANANAAAAAKVTNPTVVPEPAIAPPAPRTEEPGTESREAVTVVEAPPAPPEPKPETPAPASAPPAVSSARSSPAAGGTSAVLELPRPAASRTVPLVAAQRLTGSMPEYAAALRQRRIGGVVEVLVRIDQSGRVVSAVAVSGPPPLRQAAEAAVLKWRYSPATRNGVPIETESKVSFSFDPSQSRRP